MEESESKPHSLSQHLTPNPVGTEGEWKRRCGGGGVESGGGVAAVVLFLLPFLSFVPHLVLWWAALFESHSSIVFQ